MKTAKGGRKHRSAVSFCCDSSFAAPRGGRDANPPADYDVNPISTRAPRTGRDERAHLIELGVYLFQSSRPVWGATPRCIRLRIILSSFQSSRPVRGATRGVEGKFPAGCISIRAPRAGRDLLRIVVILGFEISIRAPRAGRDHAPCSTAAPQGHFNPRAPCGARP